MKVFVFLFVLAQHGPPGAETRVKALADFISFWAQRGLPEGRNTCENHGVCLIRAGHNMGFLGTETLVNALIFFSIVFWAQYGTP